MLKFIVVVLLILGGVYWFAVEVPKRHAWSRNEACDTVGKIGQKNGFDYYQRYTECQQSLVTNK